MKKAILSLFTLLLIVPSMVYAQQEVEIGQNQLGVNLIPIYQGIETYYLIAGGPESAGTITFSINFAAITRVETKPATCVVKKINTQKVSITTPAGTKNYEIKVYFLAKRSGLIDAHITTKLVKATVWLVVTPAEMLYDLNQDGVVDINDWVLIAKAKSAPARPIIRSATTWGRVKNVH